MGEDGGDARHAYMHFVIVTRPVVENDLDRNPLDDLHIIAKGVLGGKRENAEPVPAMMLSTFPVKILPG